MYNCACSVGALARTRGVDAESEQSTAALWLSGKQQTVVGAHSPAHSIGVLNRGALSACRKHSFVVGIFTPYLTDAVFTCANRPFAAVRLTRFSQKTILDHV